MIDTHAHIDTEVFDEDRYRVLEDAFEAGVEAIVIPAIEPKDFKRVLHAKGLSEKIYAGMGVHPHNAGEVNSAVLGEIEALVDEHDDIVAVGETGLDYHYDFNPANVQKEAFINQIAIAKNMGYPMIIHNRESEEDLLKILKKEQDGNLQAVLHCFSADEETLEEALDFGFHVSFTGNITFKKSKLAPIVEKAPLEKIMIETDSPYMAPTPFRGKRNTPALVEKVAEKIAEIKSISKEEVIKMTTNTARKFFNLTILLLSLSLFALPAFAQVPDSEYFDEEEEYAEEDRYFNPYKKVIGGGFLLGTNTIVQVYQPGDDERSQEGILALGGGFNYFLNDYLSVSLSHFYSKNSKMADENPEYGLGANKHHMSQLTLYGYTTPWKIINIFGMAGVSFSHNEISTGTEIISGTTPEDRVTRPIYEIDTDFGINTGVGLMANINAGRAGIFTVSAEWKVDFILGSQSFDTDFRVDPSHPDFNKPIEISNFYSVPQFKIYWYPKLK